jgi:hypothetical protein
MTWARKGEDRGPSRTLRGRARRGARAQVRAELRQCRGRLFSWGLLPRLILSCWCPAAASIAKSVTSSPPPGTARGEGTCGFSLVNSVFVLAACGRVSAGDLGTGVTSRAAACRHAAVGVLSSHVWFISCRLILAACDQDALAQGLPRIL